jgi:hypothetical protein
VTSVLSSTLPGFDHLTWQQRLRFRAWPNDPKRETRAWTGEAAFADLDELASHIADGEILASPPFVSADFTPHMNLTRALIRRGVLGGKRRSAAPVTGGQAMKNEKKCTGSRNPASSSAGRCY